MKRSFIILMALLACACAKDQMIPDIRYGEDACDECQMIINETRFACAYALDTGQARRFDDIGDMLAYISKTGEHPKAIWVADFEGGPWLDAYKAWFVHSKEIHTPMGHGFIAVATQVRAEAQAKATHGLTLSWDKLKQQTSHTKETENESKHEEHHHH